jgi:hypothetical protein
MIVEGVQCEICEKFVSTKTTYLPGDWFTVTHNQRELHFCRLNHLREWAAKEMDMQDFMEGKVQDGGRKVQAPPRG